jgi:hypothetical protein
MNGDARDFPQISRTKVIHEGIPLPDVKEAGIMRAQSDGEISMETFERSNAEK